MAQDPIHVDVVSDVVCPWCFIGKRRLEAALTKVPATLAQAAVVRWHPFELNPDLPAQGVDRRAYLEQKFGGPERAASIYQRVREAGRTVGIDFAFDRIARQPNTRDAHRLVAWAQANGHDAGALVERLFGAYFLEGRYVGDRDELAALARDAGLDEDEARAHLASGGGSDAIASAEDRARELGVTGVPFFIFNGRLAVSGAQPSEVLAQAITQATQTGPAPARP